MEVLKVLFRFRKVPINTLSLLIISLYTLNIILMVKLSNNVDTSVCNIAAFLPHSIFLRMITDQIRLNYSSLSFSLSRALPLNFLQMCQVILLKEIKLKRNVKFEILQYWEHSFGTFNIEWSRFSVLLYLRVFSSFIKFYFFCVGVYECHNFTDHCTIKHFFYYLLVRKWSDTSSGLKSYFWILMFWISVGAIAAFPP